MAFDLGATYKVMDDLTVSAALTDLGFINWKNAQHASSAGEWEFEGFGKKKFLSTTTAATLAISSLTSVMS